MRGVIKMPSDPIAAPALKGPRRGGVTTGPAGAGAEQATGRGAVPKVSIGLPVFNGGGVLEATLTALVNQTFPDFELIICDNASTDGTEAIGRAFAAQDPRVRYERNTTNIGLSGNYNRVFSLARGPYFKWATSDDVCLPGFLAPCVAVLDDRWDVVLAYPRTEFIDSSDKVLPIEDSSWHLPQDSATERFRLLLSVEHWVNSILGVIRRSALAKTRLMRNYPGSDYSLLAELSLQGKFIEVPEVLYRRRLHPGSMSQHVGDPAWEERYWGWTITTLMPRWSRSLDHMRTILGADLSAGEKLSLYRQILRDMHSQRGRLWKEVGHAMRVLMHRVRPSAP